MKPSFFSLVFISALLLDAPSSPAQITGLKARIPTDANAVVLIDTEKLFGSAVADRGRWEARRQAAFDAGVTFLSPNTTGVVIASKLDLEFGTTIWELAQVRLNQPGNTVSVATRFGGDPDTISGKRAVRLPNDSYVVEVTPTVYGSYTPANRQEVARWLALTDQWSSADTFTPYIDKAFSYVEEVGTPIILALDLQGAFSQAQVTEKLKQGMLKDMDDAKLAPIAEALSSIEGTMLGITVGESIVGSIRVDFSSDVTPVKPIAKALLLNVLQKQGAMIPEISEWEERYADNTMLLKGTLSESSLRRVLSVLELPPSLAQSMDEVRLSGGDSPESLRRVASQQYFNSVTGILDGLQDTRRNANTVTTGGVGMWYQKAARKIDNLPLLNVDEDLLDWGSDISTLLRGGETAMKSAGARSAIRTGQNNTSAGYQSYYGYNDGYGYGYGNYNGYRTGYGYNNRAAGMNAATLANREKGRTDALIRQQERSGAAMQATQMWQIIDQKTAEVRRLMTEKYQIEF